MTHDERDTPPAVRIAADLGYLRLKEQHRACRDRDGWPRSFSIRIHRALSWLDLAEHAGNDADVRFLALWIAFNSAYARHLGDAHRLSESQIFRDYLEQLIACDPDGRIEAALWFACDAQLVALFDNRYVFEPYWRHQNGDPAFSDWKSRLADEKRRAMIALKDRQLLTTLCFLFNRLYVLRNQLVHGGATWGSDMNRGQIADGLHLLEQLVPLFIGLMMDCPSQDWGPIYYEPVER